MFFRFSRRREVKKLPNPKSTYNFKPPIKFYFSNTAFWVGYRENGGVTTTQYGFDMPWNIPYAENEPNDAAGNEECVRIINGQANDARCSRNWTGNRNDDLGMGFICEKQPCK